MKNFWSKLKKPILALAPMAGVTDSAFRHICKDLGADVVYTEMISADALHHGSKKTLEMLKFNKKEKPIVLQLFGKHPECFIKATQIVTQAGFDGIDINFGCPAKKVVAHGGGVTLMRNLPLCREIIKNVLNNTKLPVSVKIRSSINKETGSPASLASLALHRSGPAGGKEKITATNFVKFMADLPLTAIMVHGRPYENPFQAEIDYGMIKKVKRIFKGIVLGNGGIFMPELGQVMLEKTTADGLGLARGLYGHPWLFQQIKDLLQTGKYKIPTEKQINYIAIQHAKYAFQAKDKYGIIEMRKHLACYTRGRSNASELRQKLVRVNSLDEIKEILK